MNNRGITLISLVVMISIIIILSVTSVYVGIDAIQNSKEQTFLSQLKEINDAVNLHKYDYESLGYEMLEIPELFDEQYDYYLSTAEDYEKIGLYNITIDVYVNFEKGLVYSDSGINGKHSLEDFGIEYYKPEQVQETNNAVNFQIEQLEDWNFIIKDINIECNGNVLDGDLLYSEYINGNKHNWKRVLDRTTIEENRTRI